MAPKSGRPRVYTLPVASALNGTRSDRSGACPLLALLTSSAQAQVLTGDARLACEALLCLSAVGSPPGECSKALAKYEAMKAQLWFNPLAVYNFLKGCPKK